MHTLEQRFQVEYRYPVHFTRRLFDLDNPLLTDVLAGEGGGEPARVLFVVDDGVHRNWPDLLGRIDAYCAKHGHALRLAAPTLLLPGGEAAKNDPCHVSEVYCAVHDARLDRQSYIAAVGGGALLDVVGFAAATAHRGIRLVRVPTTVLAQNDSGMGVKNGINHLDKKNWVGTFTPPFAVINDLDFLLTLSDRDWRSGIAEAVKVALVKDADFFAFIEREAASLARREMRAMEPLVQRCAELHLDHIGRGGDPFELTSARPLDFGHWAAHKLEQLSGHVLRHGEAVAIGIALDSTYSRLAGQLALQAWERVIAVLAGVGFALYSSELDRHLDNPDSPRSLLAGLDEFRQHLGGRLTITLLRDVGRGFDVHEIDLDLMRRAIDELCRLEARRARRPRKEEAPI